MARTTINHTYSDFADFNERAKLVLVKNGYKPVNEYNEEVWKCGIGMMTAMKYIKIEYSGGNVAKISGWVRGVVGKEMGLGGIVGCIPKKQVKKVMNEIIGK